MKKEIAKFGKICCKTQEELKVYLSALLSSKGYKVVNKDGFIYAKGELPYLVTAHMDTVHEVQVSRYNVHKWKGQHRIQAPKIGIGGDDRCGIYMIVRMILDGLRPSVLFCEDEEIGSVGARKFCKTKYVNDLKELNYLIELDRANSNDAVFYDCDNPEFTKFIIENTGYKEAHGTWTDIVELSDECGIASVNFSCGYYNAHRTNEYVIFEEMQRTICTVEKLLSMESEQFKFIKKVSRYNNWYDDYYWKDVYYGNYEREVYDIGDISGLEIHYNDYSCGTAQEQIVYIAGDTEDYCMYTFFREYPDVCYNDLIDAFIM